MSDFSAPVTLAMLGPVAIFALFVIGMVQAWRHSNGTSTAARLRALEEELEALRRDHDELGERLRHFERQS